MQEQLKKILDEKLSTIVAHARCVNLFLSIELESTNGNKNIEEQIKIITEQLPQNHKASTDSSPIQSFLLGQTFISLISEFEGFLVDIMIWVLKMHPHKLGTETFKLAEILELVEPEEIIRVAAERHINQIMYKRANEYKRSLIDMLSADNAFLSKSWAQYVEFKARRDLGVHNGWLVNDTYVRKVKEVGIECSISGFQPPKNDYFWDAVELLIAVINEIVSHCDVKFPCNDVARCTT